MIQEFLALLISADSVEVVNVYDNDRDQNLAEGAVVVQFAKNGEYVGNEYRIEGSFDLDNSKVLFNQISLESSHKPHVEVIPSFSIYGSTLDLFNKKIKGLTDGIIYYLENDCEVNWMEVRKKEIEDGKALFRNVREWVGKANSIEDFISFANGNDCRLEIWNEEPTYMPNEEQVIKYDINVIGDNTINVNIYRHKDGHISLESKFELVSRLSEDWDAEYYTAD